MSAPLIHPVRVERPAIGRRDYAVECLPDKQQQAGRLEVLRYKWGGYIGRTGAMQVLGDWGRKWFPWIQGQRWF